MFGWEVIFLALSYEFLTSKKCFAIGLSQSINEWKKVLCFLSVQNNVESSHHFGMSLVAQILLFCGYFWNRYYLQRIIAGPGFWNIMKEETILDSYSIGWGSQKRIPENSWERGLNKLGGGEGKSGDRLWMTLIMSPRSSNLIGKFEQKFLTFPVQNANPQLTSLFFW